MTDNTISMANAQHSADGQHTADNAGRWAPSHERLLSLRPSAHQNISQMERLISAGLGGALVLGGLVRGRWGGLVMTLVGGSLLYRGASGHCTMYQQLGIDTCGSCGGQAAQDRQAVRGMFLRESIDIARPAQELYTRWADLTHLPQILPHIKSVEMLSKGRSRWEAEGPLGKRFHWEAEIINHRPGEMIAWQSLPGGDVQTAGSVRFAPHDNQQSCTMTVTLQYDPPGGYAAARIAEWLGGGMDRRLQEDLRRFKEQMEAEPSADVSDAAAGHA